MAQSALIHVILKAIDKARIPLLRDFGELDRLQVSQKGVANFVSNADTRTEEILLDELRYARKDWGFLTEESGAHDLDRCEHRFVIDPIDGTTNFIHAIPYFCISIAAQKRIGENKYETIAGVIVDPIHDETFVAERGQGAKANHKKLRVAAPREHLLLASTTPRMGRYEIDEVSKRMQRVVKSGATVRCAGAAALDLAYVAAGRYDGLWYHRLQPWDIAAGALLVEEAGGQVGLLSDAHGAQLPESLIAASAACFPILNKMLDEK